MNLLIILTIILRCSMSDYVYGGTISNGETWADAEHYCNTLFNTHLASIHSAEDNAQVQAICEEHVTENKICIIGLIALDGVWIWEDGSDVDYEYWQPAAGVDSETGYCTWLNTNNGGKWNDVSCIRYLKDNIHFICNAPTETTTDICYFSSGETIELNTCPSGEKGAYSYTWYCDENNNLVTTDFDGSDCESGNEIDSMIYTQYKYCCEEPKPTCGSYNDWTSKLDTCVAYSFDYIDALTGEIIDMRYNEFDSYELWYSEIIYCDYTNWREGNGGPTLVLERYFKTPSKVKVLTGTTELSDCTVTDSWNRVQTFKWDDYANGFFCCPL